MLLLAGDETKTPVPLCTVMFTVAVEAPPQPSHSSTTTAYLPGFRCNVVLRLDPPVVYTKS